MHYVVYNKNDSFGEATPEYFETLEEAKAEAFKLMASIEQMFEDEVDDDDMEAFQDAVFDAVCIEECD